MNEIFYNGFWRMDWGLGNPNKTAAIIACLMIAVWIFSYLHRRGFWLSLTLFAGLGVCLVHTYSRGGMLALMTGILPVLWFAPRPWPRTRIIAVVVAFWVVVGAVFGLSAYKRYGQGVVTQDRSITNRMDIWRYAPAMMVDAPGGWGRGQSADVFSRWYQPLDRSERYINLVNGHLTYLVEFGWIGRWAYLFAWIGVFSLCWPSGKNRGRSVALGIWIAFAVAMVFTAIGDVYWTWVVPVLALGSVIAERLVRRQAPSIMAFGGSGAAAVLVCLAFMIAGRGDRGIRGGRDCVIFGKGKPDMWVLVDPKVLGKDYGRTLRASLFANSNDQTGAGRRTIALALSPKDLGDTTGTDLILSGSSANADLELVSAKAAAARRVLLIQPGFAPESVQWKPEVASRIKVVFGEFSQSEMASVWTAKAKVTLLEGVGDFVPDWPEHVSELLSPREGLQAVSVR